MRLSDFSLDLRFLGGLYLRVNSGGTLKISLTQTLKHDLRNARPQRGHIHNTVLFITSRTFQKSRGQPFHVSAVPGSQGARLSFFLSPSPRSGFFFPTPFPFYSSFPSIFFFTFFFFKLCLPSRRGEKVLQVLPIKVVQMKRGPRGPIRRRPMRTREHVLSFSLLECSFHPEEY